MVNYVCMCYEATYNGIKLSGEHIQTGIRLIHHVLKYIFGAFSVVHFSPFWWPQLANNAFGLSCTYDCLLITKKHNTIYDIHS